ncbi:MAG: hypothetical protein HC869_16815 [Rhodospirillales bacterium]|nr:hypothetical protein [Rhodospirillales bacterium]
MKTKAKQHLTFIFVPMLLLTPSRWKDYELLDCGNFEKLERFGQYVTIRPEPQAVWPRALSEKEWLNMAHVKFEPQTSSSGTWKKLKKNMPDRWHIKYELPGGQTITLRMALTAFKHVGVFPEQAVNWDFIQSGLQGMKTKQPRFLNLFAYTGGATLAARASGAEVTHVDSVKQVVTWANENMTISELDNIRWLVDDALKFVKREQRRGIAAPEHAHHVGERRRRLRELGGGQQQHDQGQPECDADQEHRTNPALTRCRYGSGNPDASRQSPIYHEDANAGLPACRNLLFTVFRGPTRDWRALRSQPRPRPANRPRLNLSLTLSLNHPESLPQASGAGPELTL